jgi:thiamine-monophosphate kinase
MGAGHSGVNELELMAKLVPHLAVRGGDLLIGAGEDDAAAWREDDGTFTVATCDTSVETRHFDLSRQEPEDVGWRALCFALGDLAAKGAWPTYGLVAISIPRRWDEGVPERIYAGLAELASAVGLRLVGGDTTLAPEHGSLTLMLLGSTKVEPRPRSAARPGWLVGVTGPLGGAGLHWRRPRPKLEVGTRMSVAGLCCGDISDGLLRELDKFAAAGGVGSRLRLDAVPRAEGAGPLQALASGEEVELVCCGPAPLPRELTVVGELTEGGRVVVVDGAGKEVEVPERGYDHFA